MASVPPKNNRSKPATAAPPHDTYLAQALGEQIISIWQENNHLDRIFKLIKLAHMPPKPRDKTANEPANFTPVPASYRHKIGHIFLKAQHGFIGKTLLPARLAVLTLAYLHTKLKRRSALQIDIGLPDDPIVKQFTRSKARQRRESFEDIKRMMPPTNEAHSQALVKGRRLLYVAGMPYRAIGSGYIVRTGSICDALSAENITINIAYIAYNQNTERPEPDTGHTSFSCPLNSDGDLVDLLNNARDKIIQYATHVEADFIAAGSNWLNGVGALLAARSMKLPFFYDARGLWPLTRSYSQPYYTSTVAFAFQMHMEAELMKTADHVFAISKDLAAFAKQAGTPHSKLSVVPNMIKHAHTPYADKAASRNALGLQSTDYLICYAGSVTSYERLDIILKAIDKFKTRKLDNRRVKFVIIGDGNALRTLQGIQTQLGLTDEILMLGRRTQAETKHLISVMDVMVYPRADHATFQIIPPLKPLEPMSLGVPCLFSDISPHRELAGQNNERGIIVHSYTADAWWEALTAISKTPKNRASIAKKAREWVHKERNPEKCIAPWKDILNAYNRHTSPPNHGDKNP